jgi:hypothetical protein
MPGVAIDRTVALQLLPHEQLTYECVHSKKRYQLGISRAEKLVPYDTVVC